MIGNNPETSTMFPASSFRTLIQHLPKISANIVDETRHEKILSYLCENCVDFCLDTDLELLKECLEHKDFRVVCMGLRFLAHILPMREQFFPIIQSQYPQFLTYALENVTSEHGLVRFASFEFLHGVISTEAGAEWLHGISNWTELVLLAFTDPSIYVVKSGSLVVARILRNAHDDENIYDPLAKQLVDSGFYELLKSHLDEECVTTDKMAVLELCWTVLSKSNSKAEDILRDSGIIRQCMELLMDNDRCVHMRAMEILDYTIHNCQMEFEDFFAEDLNVIVWLLDGVLPQVTDTVESASQYYRVLSVMELFVKLLRQRSRGVEILIDIESFCIGMLKFVLNDSTPFFIATSFKECYRKITSLFKTNKSVFNTSQKQLLATATLSFLRNLFPKVNPVRESLAILSNNALRNDYRLCCECLEVMRAFVTKVNFDVVKVLTKELLNDFGLHPRCFAKCVKVIEGIMEHVAEWDGDIVQSLMETLTLRINDVSSEIRESIIHFFGTLTTTEQGKSLIKRHKITPILVEKISDPSSDVRCIALKTVSKFQPISTRVASEFFQHCVNGTNDSESLVRRVSVELLQTWIEDTDNLKRLPKELDNTFFERLIIKEGDYEVTVLALRLVEGIWNRFGLKALFPISCDELLLKALEHSSRIARRDAFCVVKNIFHALQDEQVPRKNNSRLSSFYEKLNQVDFDALWDRTHEEDLYDEAIEIDTSLIGDGSEVVNEGNNVLCCYDC